MTCLTPASAAPRRRSAAAAAVGPSQRRHVEAPGQLSGELVRAGILKLECEEQNQSYLLFHRLVKSKEHAMAMCGAWPVYL